MATLLNPTSIFQFIHEEMEEMEDEEITPTVDKPISMWVKDFDVYRPSNNIVPTQKLEAGMYTVGFNNQTGFYCTKSKTESDKLFLFTDPLINNLISELDLFWSKRTEYADKKFLHKRGILLSGYPGTGKSSIISLLADKIIKNDGIVFKITGLRNLQDYVEFLSTGLRKIEPDRQIITILEDIDDYVEADYVILDFLDGKSQINNHVVICTTNNSELLPDTFLRPSRLDLLVEIPLPNEKIREEYFKFKNVPEDNLEKLVKSSEDLSIADLKELYLSVYILGYTIDDAIYKLKFPFEKKNYLEKRNSKSPLGI